MRTTILALAALVLAGSCGSGEPGIDEDAWRADIEDVMGVEAGPGDFERLRDLYVDDICESSEDEMEALGAVTADSGDAETIEVARVSISYACPDMLPAFERFNG